MRRRRIRTRAKWVCTVAACLAAALAVFSAFWGIDYCTVSADGDAIVNVSVEAGVVYGGRNSGFGQPQWAGQSKLRLDRTIAWRWGFHDEMVQAQIADG